MSSPAAVRKGNGVWVGSGGIQRTCELHWGWVRMLVRLGEAMWVGVGLPHELELAGKGVWRRERGNEGVARRRGFWSYL